MRASARPKRRKPGPESVWWWSPLESNTRCHAGSHAIHEPELADVHVVFVAPRRKPKHAAIAAISGKTLIATADRQANAVAIRHDPSAT
jgi:hypothetical protein